MENIDSFLNELSALTEKYQIFVHYSCTSPSLLHGHGVPEGELFYDHASKKYYISVDEPL